MKRNSDPLELTPHWHVDVRLETELPVARIVSARFLGNVFFGAATIAVLLYTCWLGYLSFSLSREIRDWDGRLHEYVVEADDIQRIKREYTAEAAKIDQAYMLVRPRLNVSDFIASVGRERPGALVIDMIEWTDAGIAVRGCVHETSERASRMLGGYVEQLNRNEKMTPLFREIVLTDMDRGVNGDSLRFEITFRLKPVTS